MKKTQLPAITQNERRQIIQSPMLDYYNAVLQVVPNHLISEVVNHFINRNAINLDINDRVGFGGFYLPIEEKTCLIVYNPNSLKFEYMMFDMFVDMFDLEGEYSVTDVNYYVLDKKIEDMRLDGLSQVMLNQLRQTMLQSKIINEDATLGKMLQVQLLKEYHHELN